MNLKTNYKNDILDTSVNTHRRYAVKNNSDDTVIHDDVYLEDITTYAQKGTYFGAADINEINSRYIDHDFTISTTWNNNSSYGDTSTYPYYQTISTDIFTDDSHPDCVVLSGNPTSFMTETERDNKSYLCEEVMFTGTGITLLASQKTLVSLTLRVRGT